MNCSRLQTEDIYSRPCLLVSLLVNLSHHLRWDDIIGTHLLKGGGANFWEPKRGVVKNVGLKRGSGVGGGDFKCK